MAALGLGTASVVLAQEEGEAEAEAESFIPANLHKGVNIPYLVGNTGYWWAIKKNPYDPDRIENLNTATDLQWIKAAGFDHIRIPIDPWAFGFQMLVIPTLHLGETVSYNGATGAQNLAKLKALINLAISENLAVVIGLQPEFVSQNHYDRMIGWNSARTARADPVPAGSWDFLNPNGRNLTPSQIEPFYRGIYKQDFVTGVPGYPHPLVCFWSQFLDQFDAVSAPPDKVYFGLMDEPMSAFSIKTTANTSADIDIWKLWFTNRISEWRLIQLSALQACLAKPVNWKFIASSAIGDSRELSTATYWQNGTTIPNYDVNPNWPKNMPTFGNPYAPGAPDNIGSSNMLDVLYSPNVYAPLKYTHFSGGTGDDGEYYHFTRDYKGLTPAPPTPPAPALWDAMEPGLNGVLAWQSATAGIGTVIEGNMVIPWSAPVYITGFGVSKREPGDCEPGTCTPPADRNPGYIKPGDPYYVPAPDGLMRILDDRLMWHYDMRRKSGENGWGWCAWEWIGGFGVSTSTTIHVSAGTSNRSIHARPPNGSGNTPNRGTLHPEMKKALFEWTTRPRTDF